MMHSLVPDALVILLHGVGSSGNDLQPLADILRQSFPDAVFVSPNAPDISSFGQGYQWFSVAGVTEQNRSGRVSQARPAFNATVSDIIARNGFKDRLDRVAFVGFSQGTIMALDAVASGRWPVASVIGFSGRLASPLPLNPSRNTNILLVHGDADPVISAIETDRAAASLSALDVAVKTIILKGLSHTISAEGAAHAETFLSEIFGR